MQPQDIEHSYKMIATGIIQTPVVKATRLSLQLGVDLYLKLENLQHTNAFKARGALNKLLSLTGEECEAGVIACSAGNHAQGVAYHAQKLEIAATIVMPEQTPFNKVKRTEDFGAKVILHGDSFDESMAFTHTLAQTQGLTLVHPFDDFFVVAGQGTVGLEMLKQQPDLDTLVVPVGGGGLIAGMSVIARHLQPKIEIVGAQSELFAGAKAAFDGHDAQFSGASLAEGISVREPARDNIELIKKHVNRIDLASEGEIEDAVFDLFSLEKLVVEGAAGAGLAVIKNNLEHFRGKKVGLVVCGGNIDSRLMSTLILRGLVRDGRITRLTFEILDTPGQLSDISRIIGENGANVIEVIHQRMMQTVALKQAELEVVIEARDRFHVEDIIESLKSHGYPCRL